jgi:multidrug resistance efflux pump
MSQISRFFQLSILTSIIAASMATSAPVGQTSSLQDELASTEKAMDGRSEYANFHDRKMFAAVAHAKATAALSHATYVYTMHLRLYQQNTKSEMDVLETEIAMLSASIAHSYTESGMNSEGLRYEAGQLKASWANGSARRDLKQLARLYVTIRQKYLEHSEFLLSEFTKMLKARERVYVVKTELEKRKVISAEELNQARVERDQTKAEIEVVSTQLEFAKQALSDAQKDLDSTSR